MDKPRNIPLVEGMFCQVEIPGQTMHGVYRLPGSAVTMEKQVYLSNHRHLKTTPVEVIASQGNDAIIRSGLAPGDRVIVNRLDHPLENTELDILEPPEGDKK